MRSIHDVFLICAVSFYAATLAIAEDDDIHLRIQALGESAEQARIEAARKIQEDADRRVQELEGRLAEVKQWTTAQFELGERGVIDKPQAMSQLLTRWQKNREQEIYKLLQFSGKNNGAIESGRALNALLEQVGPAAAQNHQTRLIHPEAALPLHDSSAHAQIGEDTFNRLTIQNRALGSKDSRRGNADPIDVDWPATLREERWATHRTAVEEARTRVLEELATTQGLSPEADLQLREAVGALNSAFVAYRSEWCKQPHDPATKAAEYHRIWQGLRHIRKLIGSVYFIVDAKNHFELSRREQYRGGNVEEFLSFMVRNNLQFGPPSKDGDRDAYHQVFGLMSRYYLDQSAMTQLQQRLEEEIDELKTVSRDSVKVALGQTMSEADKAALAIAEMKFLSELLDD